MLSLDLLIIMDCCQWKKPTSHHQPCSSELACFESNALLCNLLDCLIQSMTGTQERTFNSFCAVGIRIGLSFLGNWEDWEFTKCLFSCLIRENTKLCHLELRIQNSWMFCRAGYMSTGKWKPSRNTRVLMDGNWMRTPALKPPRWDNPEVCVYITGSTLLLQRAGE